jgi:signal peptidase II
VKKHWPYLLFVVSMFILDQLTKVIIARNIPIYSNIRIIPGFFNLTHIHNHGAIFGFFSQSGSQEIHLFLLASSLVALVLIIYYFLKVPPDKKMIKISLSLILAGALGNLFDRCIQGYVVDFLDFYVKNWHWPVFNVADSCISIGAILLVIIFFFKKG